MIRKFYKTLFVITVFMFIGCGGDKEPNSLPTIATYGSPLNEVVSKSYTQSDTLANSIDPSAPVAVATASATDIYSGDFIHIEDSGSYDLDGEIVSYEWRDMDNKLISTTKVLNKRLYYHAKYDFNNNGTTTYVKTLTVTDNDGKKSSVSFIVIVHKRVDNNDTLNTISSEPNKKISKVQEPTNEGNEFYFNFNLNNRPHEVELKLFISSRENTSGIVKIDGLNFEKSFDVVAGTITEIDIPKEAQKTKLSAERLAVYIRSKKDITVYGLNRQKTSTDAFLAIPVEALGLEYIAVSYKNLGTKPSQIAITATEDNTTVVFTPSVNAKGVLGDIIAFENFNIRIDAGEVIKFIADDDLTGSKIVSNRAVAVTSGNRCANVPEDIKYCDHLVEMLPPTSSFGMEYFVQPLSDRRSDIVRVVASEDNTEVKFNKDVVATLNRGEHISKTIDNMGEALQVVTSRPSLVVQYSLGTEYDSIISDPFMMLISPVKQYLRDYTFATLSKEQNFDRSFINIIAPTSGLDSLILDNISVDTSLFSRVGDSEYSSATLEIDTHGTHNIKANMPFTISVYGFGITDSYGYPGGMLIERD